MTTTVPEDQGQAQAVIDEPLFKYVFTNRNNRPAGDHLIRDVEVLAPNLEEARRLALEEHDYDVGKEGMGPLPLPEGCPEQIAFEAAHKERMQPQIDALKEKLTEAGANIDGIGDEVFEAFVNLGLDALAAARASGGLPGMGMGAGPFARLSEMADAALGAAPQGRGFSGPSPFESFTLGGDRRPRLVGTSPFQGQAPAPAGDPVTLARIETFKEVLCGGVAWLGQRLKLLPAGRSQPPVAMPIGTLGPYTIDQARAAMDALAEDFPGVVAAEAVVAPETVEEF
jgi:hypothetical protein